MLTQTKKANVKYKELQTEISFQIKELQEKLKKHQKSQKSDIENWGYVGDLNRIKEELGKLNNSLS